MNMVYKNQNIAYTQNAVLQKIIAMQVVELASKEADISSFIKNEEARILDIGCGTGFIAQGFIEKGFSYSNILQVDINRSSLKTAEQFSKTQIVDFNSPDFTTSFRQKFDLITSSMSLQWSENLQKSITDISSMLTSNGLFIFALPLDGSLQELYSTIKIPPFHFPKASDFNAKVLHERTYSENAFTALKSIHLCDLKLAEANENKQKITKENIYKLKSISTYWNIGWFMINGKA